LRITIAGIGRDRSGPARALFDDYARRLPWDLALREAEEKRPLTGAARKAAEAALLRAALPRGAVIIGLDERGKVLDSPGFAALIGRLQDEGIGDLAFVIGGADGLDPALKAECRHLLSLGAMTWPHLLVRPLLAEQLYRAHTILTGHPYHRV
jgi:23S rRNA (pseudouridine1915-N3)-methyltransferase